MSVGKNRNAGTDSHQDTRNFAHRLHDGGPTLSTRRMRMLSRSREPQFDNAEFRIIPSKHGERHAGMGFTRIGSALSEVVQEGEQGVAGLERSEALARRCHLLERLFFCFQIRFNINLCCLRALVTQP
jgi:hypothetical protein